MRAVFAIFAAALGGCSAAPNQMHRESVPTSDVITDPKAAWVATVRAVTMEQLTIAAQDSTSGTLQTEWSSAHTMNLGNDVGGVDYRIAVVLGGGVAVVAVQCQMTPPPTMTEAFFAAPAELAKGAKIPCGPEFATRPQGWVDIQTRIASAIRASQQPSVAAPTEASAPPSAAMPAPPSAPAPASEQAAPQAN